MISVVICSINPINFGRMVKHYQSLLAGEEIEIVGVHDAKGLCEGYNRGLARSRGEVVIFSHDDIEILTPEFVPRLKKHMAAFDVVGVVGTRCLTTPFWQSSGRPYLAGQIVHPHEQHFVVQYFGAYKRGMPGSQAMDGLFLAFRREAILKLGWDEETFKGYHLYDMDCTYRAFRQGYRLGVAVDIPILHASIGNFDATWQGEAQKFVAKHGATMEKLSPRRYQAAMVEVATKAEAAEIMNRYYEALPE